MKLYADYPARATRQILGDVIALLIVIGAIVVGVVVGGVISGFAVVGENLRDAGSGFRETMAEVGDTLGEVPVIGGGIRGPFDAASGAGGSISDAGQGIVDLVHAIAVFAGIATALGPILVVVAVWVIPRLVRARRAGQARDLAASPDGAELLALRALASRPVRELTSVDRRPLEAWRQGDRGAIRGLAQLELRRVGVKL
ncbi:MAG: hypothetical protein J0G30_13575 [Actinomycetales bacterium]|nr:hypothetical protein [Actinomycetales bacterium]